MFWTSMRNTSTKVKVSHVRSYALAKVGLFNVIHHILYEDEWNLARSESKVM